MSRAKPITPDPQHGHCDYMARNHQYTDMTLRWRGNVKVEICRFCEKDWKGEK